MTNGPQQSLVTIRRIRTGVVFLGVALVVLSLVQPTPILMLGRAAAWALAGALSIGEAVILMKFGHKAGSAWTNAAIFFAIALIPVLRSL